MFVDGDCGFCQRTADQIHRLGVQAQSLLLQGQDLSARGIDERRARREIAVVDAAGQVHYGHRGWAAVLRTGPAPWRAVAAAMTHRPLEPVARATYTWISANRHRLPGGTPSCAITAPEQPRT